MFSRTSSLKYRLHSISRQLAIVLAIGMSHIQCSWTPDVETLLYQSEEGTIALQTTKNFKAAPKHPAWISDSLIQEMLGGLTQTQESGLLQEIFSGSPSSTTSLFTLSNSFFKPSTSFGIVQSHSRRTCLLYLHRYQ